MSTEAGHFLSIPFHCSSFCGNNDKISKFCIKKIIKIVWRQTNRIRKKSDDVKKDNIQIKDI